MAWVEGLTNSQRILFTLANILTTANKKLVVKYRKTVNGTPTDFELTEVTPGVWRDQEGNTVDIAEYTKVMVPTNEVDPTKNWEVVYATGGSTDLAQMEINLMSSEKWEVVNGFDAKRVILRTVTTPVTVNAGYDEYNTDPDSKVDKIEMFLEIVKYRYAINPEENLEETVDPVTGDLLKMPNNHYIEIRYGDKMKIDRQYVVDKATRTEQPDKAVYNGVICNVTIDDQTQQPVYTPITGEELDLYEIVTIYGNQLLTKEEGGHPSEYAKFSWYLDYKEELVDAMDGGPSQDDISKGIRLMPQILTGMSETIPIQFWINCNNDRISMVLMGDPTIDYDRYLTSFAYIGKIDSFEGEGVVNDTAGNFALTVGSSTVPCKRPKPLQEPIKGKVEILDFQAELKNVLEVSKANDNGIVTIDKTSQFDATKYAVQGYHAFTPIPTSTPSAPYTSPTDYVDKFRVGYKFVSYSKDDETMPSNNFDFVYSKALIDVNNPGVKGVCIDRDYYSGNGFQPKWEPQPEKATVIDCSEGTYTFTLKIPKPANRLRIFKIANTANTIINNPSLPAPYVYGAFEPMYEIASIDLSVATGIVDKGDYYEFTWTETDVSAPVVTTDKSKMMPLVKSSKAQKSVERDMVLNFVLSVKFPDTWGDETTATGVTDISMFKTRSGVYNQRHYASFITPEEYMRKDAFNPSRWTGKFHLSPTYVVHGYDGYRGWLKDTVIVDNTSIVHLDELIVNKDSKDPEKPQEIFKYFKLNSPFCFLNNSPNFNYGVGILKSRSYIDSQGNRIELY
jgi:ribosomal protein S28E/S33